MAVSCNLVLYQVDILIVFGRHGLHARVSDLAIPWVSYNLTKESHSTIWIRLGDEDSTINDRLSVHFYSVAFLAFVSRTW